MVAEGYWVGAPFLGGTWYGDPMIANDQLWLAGRERGITLEQARQWANAIQPGGEAFATNRAVVSFLQMMGAELPTAAQQNVLGPLQDAAVDDDGSMISKWALAGVGLLAALAVFGGRRR